jgi:hypothetical protein
MKEEFFLALLSKMGDENGEAETSDCDYGRAPYLKRHRRRIQSASFLLRTKPAVWLRSELLP